MPVNAPEFQRNRILLLSKKPYVLQNGKPVPHKGRKYFVQTDNGTQEKVKLVTSYLTDRPGLKMGKRVLVPAKNVPGYLVLPIALPIGLAAVGGIIGGLMGSAGAGVNSVVAKSSMSTPAKIAVMILVTGIAVVAWFLIATLLFSTTL